MEQLQQVIEKNRWDFKELQNVFDIADAILVVSYDSNWEFHYSILHRMLQICLKENLKLKKKINVVSCVHQFYSFPRSETISMKSEGTQ